MKKFLVLSVVFLTLIASVQLKAQCQSGYTPMSKDIRIGECLYEVQLCVKCSAMGQLSGSVYLRGFFQKPEEDECTQTLTAQQVLDAIETIISNPDYYFSELCVNHNFFIPPCPDQSEEIVTFRHSNCWRMRLINYFGNEIIMYEVCDDAYCEETFTWCYDPITHTYNKTQIEGSPTQIGTPSCSLEAWQVNVPIIVGQYSECFIMHTICDEE
jgi:hypothetical protein